MSFINIEIKAKCFHPEKVEAFLIKNNANFIGTDYQKDTYFNVHSSRLKLRQGNIENNLIYYNRTDQAGPKKSDFMLTKVIDGKEMEKLLAASLGIKVIVEKKRKIFFIDNVKFHLDEIDSLGSFVEIEASNKDFLEKSVDDLRVQCNFYMQEFNILKEDLISISYSDMLLNKGKV